ncbi:PadR family transcriptional regulator [Faecalibacter sp. LW9]|uniref:PadR family transcriptional regulator n=1 Tax=Faecalibacter sp. LW9 TaxID=3103144 RepID=UPI002AFDE711|nr:PadR family transcriptional regulator [Faecalibacter sp. LW9]
MIDAQFYKGSLQPILLKLLNDNGKMYGYEIIQKIKALSNNEFEIKEGALYPILHKLEAENLVDVEAVKIDGRIRKYYRLTEFGEKETVNRLNSLKDTIQQIQNLIDPKLI